MVEDAGDSLNHLRRRIQRAVKGLAWEADCQHLRTLAAEWSMENCDTCHHAMLGRV